MCHREEGGCGRTHTDKPFAAPVVYSVGKCQLCDTHHYMYHRSGNFCRKKIYFHQCAGAQILNTQKIKTHLHTTLRNRRVTKCF